MSVLPHLFPIVSLLFLIALSGVALGIRLAEIPEVSRRIVPFSGGVLMGIAAFWVLPEIAAATGWLQALAGALGGFALVWLIDRLLYPVCPTCSHPHAHPESTDDPVPAMALPLLVAAAVHSFFDGWGLAVSQQQSAGDLKLAFLFGIGVHKLPEGLALGVLLLAATRSVWKAALSAAAVQCIMFVGASMALILAAHLPPQGVTTLLAIASGVFFYLGYHAIEGPSRERGLASAVMPALTGAAGAAVLRLVPGL